MPEFRGRNDECVVGSTTIMVISVSGLFEARLWQATVSSLTDVETSTWRASRSRRRRTLAMSSSHSFLRRFSHQRVMSRAGVHGIRNATHLWGANAGMPTAMRLHNQLLRRQLRLCGGYEVKTEGDAFMCSVPERALRAQVVSYCPARLNDISPHVQRAFSGVLFFSL